MTHSLTLLITLLRASIRSGKGGLYEALYFHYPHYYATTTPVSAVCAGDWKLLEYLEGDHLELCNLRNDLSEKTDLAVQMPDKAASLLQQLHHWRTQVGSAMPTANPAFK